MKTPALNSTTRSRHGLSGPALRLTPLAAALATGLFALPSPAGAATIAVVNGGCTLIDAITAANTDIATGQCPAGSNGADTITLPANSVQTLTAVDNTTAYGDYNGLPVIVSNITLVGNGSSITRDPGAPAFRILAVGVGGNLSLHRTTLSGGLSFAGSGLLIRGTAAVIDSTVSGNTATVYGGGVAVASGGALTLSGSTVSGNLSLANFGGGLIAVQSSATLVNSTVSGNSAPKGGGGVIAYTAVLTLTDSTVTGNSLTQQNFLGGGILMLSGGTLNLSRSLISGNTASLAAEIYAGISPVNANNFNLIGYGGDARSMGFTPGATDIVPAAALSAILGPLADHGGPTRTHALVAGGPAVNTAGVNCSATDQRGVNRPKGAACDVGAFEVGVNTTDLSISKTASAPSVLVGAGVSFTLAVTNNGPENATDVQVVDGLPSPLSFGSATPTQGVCALESGTVTCDLGGMASGASASVSLVTTASTVGMADNTASVISAPIIDLDPNAADNASTASVQINAVDATPNSFSFPDQTSVPLSSVRTSDAVTISDINTPVPISVSGGTFSIGCTSNFTATASLISNGQTVCVRHTSSASTGTAVNTTLTVGGVSDIFTSTTLVTDTTPNPFSFVDRYKVLPLVVITSNTVTVSGINANAPISLVNGPKSAASYSINGGPFVKLPGTVKNGDKLRLRNRVPLGVISPVNVTLSIGGVSDTWTISTRKQ